MKLYKKQQYDKYNKQSFLLESVFQIRIKKKKKLFHTRSTKFIFHSLKCSEKNTYITLYTLR